MSNFGELLRKRVEASRDGAAILGLGSLVVASVEQSPRLAVAGVAAIACSLGLEGARRLLPSPEQEEPPVA